MRFPNGFQTWRSHRATQDRDVLLHARLTCRVSDGPAPGQCSSAVGGPASCLSCPVPGPHIHSAPCFQSSVVRAQNLPTRSGRGRPGSSAGLSALLPAASEGSETAPLLPSCYLWKWRSSGTLEEKISWGPHRRMRFCGKLYGRCKIKGFPSKVPSCHGRSPTVSSAGPGLRPLPQVPAPS